MSLIYTTNFLLASDELCKSFLATEYKIPSNEDVKKIAISLLAEEAQSFEEIYEILKTKMQANITDRYWMSSKPDFFLYQNINKRRAVHINESIMKKMILEKFQDIMLEMIKDITRGPFFGYECLNPSNPFSVLGSIDEILQINSKNWKTESENKKICFKKVKEHQDLYDYGVVRSKEDVQLFQTDMLRLMRTSFLNEVYMCLESLLKTIKEQIIKEGETYYKKLCLAVKSLFSLFQTNIAEEKKNCFYSSEAEEKGSLWEKEMGDLKIADIFEKLIVLLQQNKNIWIHEEEHGESLAKAIYSLWRNELAVQRHTNGQKL